MALTRRQRELTGELTELVNELGLAFWTFEEALDTPQERTTMLEVVHRDLIRSSILLDYTLVDELVGSRIAQYFFGKGKDFRQLWRTRRFQRFNHFMLDRLYLLEKWELFKDIVNPPKGIGTYVTRLNGTRNALAHSFYPENGTAPALVDSRG